MPGRPKKELKPIKQMVYTLKAVIALPVGDTSALEEVLSKIREHGEATVVDVQPIREE